MWWKILVVYILFMYMIPKIIRNPTNIKFVDDLVMYTTVNNQYILHSAVIIGASIFIVEKWWSGDLQAPSP
jgi:hypothetical protein